MSNARGNTHNQHTQSLRDHALAYAQAGIEVFPAKPTKAPWTHHGMKDATADLGTVEAWWDEHPDALIACRIPTDVVILDIDPRHGGLETWKALKDEIGAVPITRVHASGRNDGGGHLWWIRPADQLTTARLDTWAREHGTGEQTGTRWSSGIDLLHHSLRYTILPPSPHPDTGEPYRWLEQRGLDTAPAPMPALLADLLVDDEPPPPPKPPRDPDPDPDSIADWYSQQARFSDLLPQHGWTLVAGDGDSDGSRWRHPNATAPHSATVRHGCLFVYSPNTAFEITSESRPKGYTPFRAWAELEHRGDLTAAAKAAREERGNNSDAADLAWIRDIEQRQESPENPDEPDEDSERPVTFRRWSTSELLDADRTFRWRLRGILVQPTFGMIGGEQKTLKSYVSTFLDLALATGTPLFDQFAVDDPGPVVAYVGEGGRIPYTRRLERIARSMDIDLKDADLYSTFDVASIESNVFNETLRRDLKELEPALIHIDPYYAYHGTNTKSSDLHAEGHLLTSISTPCVAAGTCLLINNHFNQTGTKTGLSRLTMAGGQEWVDSWVLLSHREHPDVDNGRFKLLLEIGSRQWGGTSWDLDLNVGKFNIDEGEFDGDISWSIERHDENTARNDAEFRILEAVTENPGQLTREEAAKRAKVKITDARNLVDALENRGLIRPVLTQIEGQQQRSWRYQPVEDPGRPDVPIIGAHVPTESAGQKHD